MRKMLLLLLFVAFARTVFALEEDAFPTETTLDAGKPAKKRPSFFHRPSRATPEAQLAYADALRKAGRLRRAGKQYRALVHQWHAAPQAPVAQHGFASVLDQRRKWRRAFDEYQYLIDYFAGEFAYEAVLERQFVIAQRLMTERVRLLYIPLFRAPERALPLFEQIVKNAPAWTRAPKAQFLVGAIHEQGRDYDLAATSYETLGLRYPLSDLAAEAQYRRARCLYRLAKAAPRDEQVCREALSALSAFTVDRPADPHAKEASAWLAELKNHLAGLHYERATFYDKMKTRPRAALIAYTDFVKRFPASAQAEAARARMEALEAQLGEQQTP
jgi:tetratricopeptide (TPR) repeat protein